jgi:hypothetical protein
MTAEQLTMRPGQKLAEKTDRAGQEKWASIRKAVVRRRAEAEAFEHAKKVEADTVKRFVKDRRKTSLVVAKLVEQRCAANNGRKLTQSRLEGGPGMARQSGRERRGDQDEKRQPYLNMIAPSPHRRKPLLMVPACDCRGAAISCRRRPSSV